MMINNVLDVNTGFLHTTVQVERVRKVSNLVMRVDEFCEMRKVEIKEGSKDLSTEEHEYSEKDKLGVGEDFHVDGGHGRDGEGGNRSEEEVQVMRT